MCEYAPGETYSMETWSCQIVAHSSAGWKLHSPSPTWTARPSSRGACSSPPQLCKNPWCIIGVNSLSKIYPDSTQPSPTLKAHWLPSTWETCPPNTGQTSNRRHVSGRKIWQLPPRRPLNSLVLLYSTWFPSAIWRTTVASRRFIQLWRRLLKGRNSRWCSGQWNRPRSTTTTTLPTQYPGPWEIIWWRGGGAWRINWNFPWGCTHSC